MDYRIYKYTLEIPYNHIVEMPQDAQILSVANQDGNLCLWAMGDVDRPSAPRLIETIGTGHPVVQDMGVERRFIGTVLINQFVWHVFERT